MMYSLKDVCEQDEIESGMQSSCSHLKEIKEEIKASRPGWGIGAALGSFLFGIFLVSTLSDLVGAAWHSKWRYATEFSTSTSAVTIAAKPHDCAFLAAPVGEKYCHHNRVVSTVRWSTSAGNPIVSPPL